MFIKYTLAVLVSHSSSRPPRSSPSLALGRVHLPRLSTPTTIQFYNTQHDVTHLDLELIHDKSSSSMSWKRVEYRTTVTNFTWSVVTDSSADLVPGVCLAEHGLPSPPPAWRQAPWQIPDAHDAARAYAHLPAYGLGSETLRGW